MLTAVTGINWGDEGKGRVIDLLAEQADIVVRYQGGNNAGHTVVTDKGKFVLNLLPSGILHPDVVCVLGDGMVIDLEHLSNEAEQIKEKGISVTPDNLNMPLYLCLGTRFKMNLKKTDYLQQAVHLVLHAGALLMPIAINTARRHFVLPTFFILIMKMLKQGLKPY